MIIESAILLEGAVGMTKDDITNDFSLTTKKYEPNSKSTVLIKYAKCFQKASVQ